LFFFPIQHLTYFFIFYNILQYNLIKSWKIINNEIKYQIFFTIETKSYKHLSYSFNEFFTNKYMSLYDIYITLPRSLNFWSRSWENGISFDFIIIIIIFTINIINCVVVVLWSLSYTSGLGIGGNGARKRWAKSTKINK